MIICPESLPIWATLGLAELLLTRIRLPTVNGILIVGLRQSCGMLQVSRVNNGNGIQPCDPYLTRWLFQILFIFTPIWGNNQF